ncbi:hypothetical protein [Legionella sp.]|uniref:hypothetical protein n=1 Tax=Legionella sp. TaxID=459 RepID=UPI003C8508B9
MVVIGGVNGLGIGLWTLIEYVQPALVSTSLTSSQASGITAAIAIFGYLETAVGTGILAALL